MIANTILVQRGGDLEPTTAGVAVPNASDGDRYWTQGMIAWNGQTLGDLAADADLYKPRFTEVTLPA